MEKTASVSCTSYSGQDPRYGKTQRQRESVEGSATMHPDPDPDPDIRITLITEALERKLLKNAGKHVLDYRASQSRRQQSSRPQA
jgi:hypothetical protein